MVAKLKVTMFALYGMVMPRLRCTGSWSGDPGWPNSTVLLMSLMPVISTSTGVLSCCNARGSK